MEINIGIKQDQRVKIAEGLSRLLADTYTLYVITHNFHWNVTGPMFHALHVTFEEQYKELAMAVDRVAERIRALGFPAPGTYAQFVALTRIAQPEGVLPAEAMIRELVRGQEAVIDTARSLLAPAEQANDAATVDLLSERIRIHEKNAWMLRSSLDS